MKLQEVEASLAAALAVVREARDARHNEAAQMQRVEAEAVLWRQRCEAESAMRATTEAECADLKAQLNSLQQQVVDLQRHYSTARSNVNSLRANSSSHTRQRTLRHIRHRAEPSDEAAERCGLVPLSRTSSSINGASSLTGAADKSRSSFLDLQTAVAAADGVPDTADERSDSAIIAAAADLVARRDTVNISGLLSMLMTVNLLSEASLNADVGGGAQALVATAPSPHPHHTHPSITASASSPPPKPASTPVSRPPRSPEAPPLHTRTLAGVGAHPISTSPGASDHDTAVESEPDPFPPVTRSPARSTTAGFPPVALAGTAVQSAGPSAAKQSQTADARFAGEGGGGSSMRGPVASSVSLVDDDGTSGVGLAAAAAVAAAAARAWASAASAQRHSVHSRASTISGGGWGASAAATAGASDGQGSDYAGSQASGVLHASSLQMRKSGKAGYKLVASVYREPTPVSMLHSPSQQGLLRGPHHVASAQNISSLAGGASASSTALPPHRDPPHAASAGHLPGLVTHGSADCRGLDLPLPHAGHSTLAVPGIGGVAPRALHTTATEATTGGISTDALGAAGLPLAGTSALRTGSTPRLVSFGPGVVSEGVGEGPGSATSSTAVGGAGTAVHRGDASVRARRGGSFMLQHGAVSELTSELSAHRSSGSTAAVRDLTPPLHAGAEHDAPAGTPLGHENGGSSPPRPAPQPQLPAPDPPPLPHKASQPVPIPALHEGPSNPSVPQRNDGPTSPLRAANERQAGPVGQGQLSVSAPAGPEQAPSGATSGPTTPSRAAWVGSVSNGGEPGEEGLHPTSSVLMPVSGSGPAHAGSQLLGSFTVREPTTTPGGRLASLSTSAVGHAVPARVMQHKTPATTSVLHRDGSLHSGTLPSIDLTGLQGLGESPTGPISPVTRVPSVGLQQRPPISPFQTSPQPSQPSQAVGGYQPGVELTPDRAHGGALADSFHTSRDLRQGAPASPPSPRVSHALSGAMHMPGSEPAKSTALTLHWLSPPRTALVVCKLSPAVYPLLNRVLMWLRDHQLAVYVEPSALPHVNPQLRTSCAAFDVAAADVSSRGSSLQPPSSDLCGGSSISGPTSAARSQSGTARASGVDAPVVIAASTATTNGVIAPASACSTVGVVSGALGSMQPGGAEPGGWRVLSWPEGRCPNHSIPDEVAQDLDFVVVLGGDGTLLWTCHVFGNRAVPPLLPFNMGSLGFLTPFPPAQLESMLQHITDGGFPMILRHRLHATIVRAPNKHGHPVGGDVCWADGHCASEKVVLNEVVVDRGISPFLTNLECYCDGNFVTHVQGDGLIISTPTGSTAYSLAAGGSMVHPQVPGMLFTPVCPHSLSFRPLVFPDHVQLSIQVPYGARAQMYCSFDGKDRQELNAGDAILIRMSQWPIPTVCSADPSCDWFTGVREGLHWNVRRVQAGAGN